MASHKNQHFVPRCYLKPFTLNGDGKAIHLFNIEIGEGRKNAAVKGQCARAFFYSEDLELEKALQSVEGLYADALRRITSPKYNLTDDDKFFFRFFCYLQHLRTESASRRSSELMSEVADVAHGENLTPEEWRTTIRDAVLVGMRAFVATRYAIEDMKMCLVRNLTKVPFVTSDDPAVLTNKWYAENPLAKGMSAGVENTGALFLLPLTPQILGLIYDGDVYSIPNEAGWIAVKKVSDIEAFNQHQYLWCFANIYFSDWSTLYDVEANFAKFSPHRPAKRHEINVAIPDKEIEGGQRYRVVTREQFAQTKVSGILHSKLITPTPTQWPSIIKWRSKPKLYSNGSATGFIRPARVLDLEHLHSGYRRVE